MFHVIDAFFSKTEKPVKTKRKKTLCGISKSKQKVIPYEKTREGVFIAHLGDIKVKKLPEFTMKKTKGVTVNSCMISDSDDIFEILKKLYEKDLAQEHAIVLFLDPQLRVIGYARHSVGTTTSAICDVKIIVAQALKCLAHNVVFSHNHPSDFAYPSSADVIFTDEISNALWLFDMNLLDHVIFTDYNGYYSFKNDRKIKKRK